jgi:hypothetical protein
MHAAKHYKPKPVPKPVDVPEHDILLTLTEQEAAVLYDLGNYNSPITIALNKECKYTCRQRAVASKVLTRLFYAMQDVGIESLKYHPYPTMRTVMTKPQPCAIHVGISDIAAKTVADAILLVVQSESDKSVQLEALRVLKAGFEVQNCIIHDCEFTVKAV